MTARSREAAPPDDPSQIDACRRGDRRALGELFARHAPSIERLIFRVVGPQADVEDLLQTTFEAAIRAFPNFRGEASVRTWLTRIAIHTAHDRLRRPDHKRRVQLEIVDATDDETPDRTLTTKRALDRLYLHLAAIAPKKRIAFVLHVVEGRPMDEVAALMQATETATKSRVFFARRELMARARKDAALREILDGGAP